VWLVQGDILALPYANERFDVVTSFQVLPHVPGDEEAVFGKAYRVLKPGGMLFVDPVVLRGAKKTKMLIRVVATWSRFIIDRSNIRAWRRFPTREELADQLTGAGFEAYGDHGSDLDFLIWSKPRASRSNNAAAAPAATINAAIRNV